MEGDENAQSSLPPADGTVTHPEKDPPSDFLSNNPPLVVTADDLLVSRERHGSGSRSRHSSGAGSVRGVILSTVTGHSRDSSPSSTGLRTASPLNSSRDSMATQMRIEGSPGSVESSPLVAHHLPARPTRQRNDSETSDHGGARPKTRLSRPQSASEQNHGPLTVNINPQRPTSERQHRRHGSYDSHLRSELRENRSSRSDQGQNQLYRNVELVKEESENILVNYMYERYNSDAFECEGRSVPRSPTLLDHFTQHPQSSSAEIGRRLAQIGDEINVKYRNDFRNMSKMLNVDMNSTDLAYQAFAGVCRRLFAEGVMNWGRIVALLQFGYYLAIDRLTKGVGDFMKQVIALLVKFIAVEKIKNVATHVHQSIAEWIASQGGWLAANESIATVAIPEGGGTVLAALAGVSLLVVLTAIWWKNR